MLVTRNEGLESELAATLLQRLQWRSEGRPPGPHVSEIISDIAIRTGMLRVDPNIPRDLPWQKFMMGFIWEDMIGRELARIRGVVVEQLEVEQDGILGTLDDYDPSNGGGSCIWEYKATWYSTNRDVMTDEVFWRWWTQIKAYCYMVGVQHANLVVFFVNEDYRPPTPQWPKVYSAAFMQEELKQNWRMLYDHYKLMYETNGGPWW